MKKIKLEESILDYLKINYREVDESKDSDSILNEKLEKVWAVTQELEKDNEKYYKKDNGNPLNMTNGAQIEEHGTRAKIYRVPYKSVRTKYAGYEITTQLLSTKLLLEVINPLTSPC